MTIRATNRTSRAAHPPLFLIGAARSGTSMLFKALCLNPEVAYISNYVRRAPGAPALAALNRIARRSHDAQMRVWFGGDSNAYVYNKRRSVADRLFPMPVEGEPVFARCDIPEFDVVAATPERLAALRKSFARITKYSGGSVLVNKRIANNRRIPLLIAAFPDARFVEIVRDGRAVAFSLKRVNWWEESHVWWAGSTPKQWAAEGRDPWEICARNWVEELNEIDAGFAAVPGDQALRIRYEDLLAAPVERLTEIATFGGIEPIGEWVDRLGTLRFPNMNETWRERLGADEVASIEEIQRPLLNRYGYLGGSA